MPRTISCEQLIKAVEDETFIKNGIISCAEGVKYDFRMSSSVLKASEGRPIDIDKLTESEKTKMVVEPGEVVFVLSEESLLLPNNIMAQLVPKRKLSHEGIIVLGGFCIDPLYEGKLLVGLYNYSSTNFTLEPLRKLIAAVFYELREDEIGTMPKPKEAVVKFPNDLQRLIKSYQPIDMKGLNDEIRQLGEQIVSLRNDVTTDKEWKKDFQTKLATQSENIDKLLEGLNKEEKNRLAKEAVIDKQLTDMQVMQGKNATQSHANFWIILAIISAIVAISLFLLGYWLASKPAAAPPPDRGVSANANN
jgi:deoxycytidine triphosphate deaminase